tara:strand:- start:2935 stop:3102 length:168 start_codon:yes stop_codon:yes gene_type:complete
MKYPRTMNEAFPKTADYGAAIKKYKEPVGFIDLCIWTIAASVLVFLLLSYFFWRK